jgi:tetratricopeptide (TPR) repeat protein
MHSKTILAVSFYCLTVFSAFAAENKFNATPNIQVKQKNMESAFDHLNKAKAMMKLSPQGSKPDRDTIEQLNKAMFSLEKAAPNKGGHREAAMGLLNQALVANTNAKTWRLVELTIEEVKKGMAYADNSAAQKAAEKAAPPVQKNMVDAIDHLEKAKAMLSMAKRGSRLDKDAIEQFNKANAKLEQASPNKGGHREKAIGLINQAVRASTPETATKLADLAMDEIKRGIAFADKHGR